ncbi:single-stranded DNA-binding protein [Dolosicoccus paucivorans]|uniref:Single-stranded DNA-binding protein n=1 Tax=Dolosicoccus paucivorans TaxID=84521 RepID=A0A1G8MS42_9LACT|nr:single-stranded DNA-binding protein [Dolosicoccus paucivorans]PMB84174.1 single-stranded DNA-binding protein [Dolosicoccus paucivorans]PMC58424.1 single-stranded DNA-binding protein [Dolosicoccus paucivorans]SDI70734.1 single-strand DNA-binding protein [Dolosicoccus paucivorans]
MNQVNFVGRIVKEVEVKSVGASHVVNNTLAVQRPRKNKDGEHLTDFIPFVAWDGLARVLGNYCQKGQQIAISGRMQSRNYQNKDGQMVYVIECLVNDLTLLDRSYKQEEDLTEELVDGHVDIPQNMIEEVVEEIQNK